MYAGVAEALDLIVVSNNNDWGNVTGSGKYFNYDDPIIITATSNDGYIFIGWYDGENLLSSNSSYSFYMCDMIPCSVSGDFETIHLYFLIILVVFTKRL